MEGEHGACVELQEGLVKKKKKQKTKACLFLGMNPSPEGAEMESSGRSGPRCHVARRGLRSLGAAGALGPGVLPSGVQPTVPAALQLGHRIPRRGFGGVPAHPDGPC